MSKIRAVIFDCYSTLVDIKTDELKEEVLYYLSLYLQYYGARIDVRKLKSALDDKAAGISQPTEIAIDVKRFADELSSEVIKTLNKPGAPFANKWKLP